MDESQTQGNGLTVADAFIYKLGQALGGRREVLAAPMQELLRYMGMQMTKEEQEAEKEQAKMWINYLTAMFTQPSFGGKEDPNITKGRQELVEMLKPKPKKTKSKEGSSKVIEWDFGKLQQLKAKQDALQLERGN